MQERERLGIQGEEGSEQPQPVPSVAMAQSCRVCGLGFIVEGEVARVRSTPCEAGGWTPRTGRELLTPC